MSTIFKLGAGTGVAVAGAVTLNERFGKVTSESLTTAAAASYTLTITSSDIQADNIAFASLANGTNTQGRLSVRSVTPANGSLVIVIDNTHASQALNGTIVVTFAAFGA